jgi:integrase
MSTISKNITQAKCEATVSKRTKHYDGKVSGLYVSLSPTSPATFFLRYTDSNMHTRRMVKLGVYHAELFNVDHARIEAMALKFRIGRGEDVAQTKRQTKTLQAKLSGVTVDQIIDERIAWMSTLVKKADGEMRARKESWANTASHLNRFVRPRLGKRIASEVTKHDIAKLSDDIVNGELGKPSISNARHVRRALSAMFNWAAEAGRDYVTASPCINLPPLDEEHARTRVLTEDEIRTLWHGLDREEMPWDRKTRLAIKFALVTMLRSTELLHIHRDELNVDNGEPVADIPAKRVKKRRVINQPLSDLAMQIVKESLGNYDYVFVGRFGDKPLARNAMATALRGTPKTKGICELLGLAPFTPHDLRRTAATIAGRWFSDAEIAPCLDHQPTKDANGKPLPAVTGKHYNHAQRKNMQEKRRVLDRWAAELRRIIGEPVQAKAADAEMRLAA